MTDLEINKQNLHLVRKYARIFAPLTLYVPRSEQFSESVKGNLWALLTVHSSLFFRDNVHDNGPPSWSLDASETGESKKKNSRVWGWWRASSPVRCQPHHPYSRVFCTLASLKRPRWRPVKLANQRISRKNRGLRTVCELWGTNNVEGKISQHVFAPNEGCCLYLIAYKYFSQHAEK